MKTTHKFSWTRGALIAFISTSVGIAGTVATDLTAYTLSSDNIIRPSQYDVMRRYVQNQNWQESQFRKGTQKYIDSKIVEYTGVDDDLYRNNRSYRNAVLRRQKRLAEFAQTETPRKSRYEYCSDVLGLTGTRLTRCVGVYDKHGIDYQLTQSHQNPIYRF